MTWAFDGLGRVTSEENLLGEFAYTYDGVTNRLATVTYPNDQTSTYTYLDDEGDHRLQTIHHKYPNTSTLSKFDYTYDAVGNILTWRQQADTTAVMWDYAYDPAGQLISAVKTSTATPATILQRYAYAYDPAGNRTVEQLDDAVTLSAYNNLNRLTSQAPGGPMIIDGSLNEPGTVTISGVPLTVDANHNFRGTVPTTTGTNTFTIVAKDPTGNTTTQQYEVDVAGTGRTFTYDHNGNLTGDGSRSLEWDARNQLLAVNIGTHRTEHRYDAEQRRVASKEFSAGVEQTSWFRVWCERFICDERAGGVTVAVLSHGSSGQVDRLTTRDHLGDIRDVSALDGTRVSAFSYDPFGRQTIDAGTEYREAFAGYSISAAGDQLLAMYRAYDPDLGRWLSEDPAGLAEGFNLNIYVRNRPSSGVDPFGDAECGNCSIAVKCTPIVSHWIGLLGFSHCFAQVKLADGSILRRDGGRTPAPGGDLLTAHKNPGPGTGNLMWSENPSDCGKANCVASGGNGGNANSPYRIVGNNSSNYLDRVLRGCGYPPIVNISNRN